MAGLALTGWMSQVRFLGKANEAGLSALTTTGNVGQSPSSTDKKLLPPPSLPASSPPPSGTTCAACAAALSGIP